MDLQELYEQHQSEMQHDGANFVPGVGEYKGYMFIAEAPGATEDLYREPLIGASGQLLRRTLDEIEFPPERFYTNIWKFRPLGNRTPYYTEVVAGTKCLRQEIAIVRPHTLVILGHTANRALFPRPIKRGELLKRGSFRIMATYHPGYLLEYRHPELIPDFKAHLLKAVLTEQEDN